MDVRRALVEVKRRRGREQTHWHVALRLLPLVLAVLMASVALGPSGPVAAQPPDQSQFVSQQVPLQVAPGQTFVAELTFRNSGATTWTRWEGIKLGATAPQDTLRWGLNRQRLRNRDQIAPGELKTFYLELRAPTTAGAATLQWRLLREGVHWFGAASTALSVQVGSGGSDPGGGGGGGEGGGGGGNPPSSARQYADQVFVGYQGWFSAPGDGTLNRWGHWSRDTSPRPGQVRFELYPDVREVPPRDLFGTQLGNLGNGAPAQLFASNRDGVVDLHFRWMREYGIDGAALQRFVGELASRPYRRWRNQMTDRVRAAAERHGRSFYVMYDISGADPRSWVAQIQHDWEEVLKRRYSVTTSPAYARQDGRPVVGLWGLGLHDRPGTREESIALIHWLRERGAYVVGGVPYYWRDAVRDSKGGWQDVYLTLDSLLPWSVGRYATDSDLEHHYQTVVLPDVAHAEAHGVSYQRVLFPGQAWSNWNGGARNQVPRRSGDLLWRQAYYARQAGVGAFIAMFDEYDEATAIAKAAENASQIPHNQYFLTLDADGAALPSDHYLWLSGQATRMIRGEIPLQYERPTR